MEEDEPAEVEGKGGGICAVRDGDLERSPRSKLRVRELDRDMDVRGD